MEHRPDGRNESLIPSSQEKTALRTHNFLVAARLAFLFFHGLLLICASANIGQDEGSSWWAVFTPVWLGDAICAGLIGYSWFASCPYIQLCMAERQARLGDTNPSILTELLPEIVMAIVGLLFMIIVLIAELLFCRYLDTTRQGQPANLVPSAVVFILLSCCACCRGVCIRTDSELFSLLGAGTLAMFVAALMVPGGPEGHSRWVLAVPPLLACGGLFVAGALRLRRSSLLGWSREERILRAVELLALMVVLIAFTVLLWELSSSGGCKGADADRSCEGVASAGITAGAGAVVIAALRARMAVLESRAARSPCCEPTPGWVATPMANPDAGH